ncbi:MAG: Rnf-Nqr domain containing protein [Bacilli bacterium]
MKTILNSFKNENYTFILIFGLCSILAVTNKFETAYIIGICVLIVLILSSLIIMLIKNIIPESAKMIVYILIIGIFVTIIEFLFNRYIPALSKSLGIYLPLIAINCFVLGKKIFFAEKDNVSSNLINVIKIGFGITLALMLIASIREVLGTNTITIMDSLSDLTGYKAIYKILPNTNILPIKFFITPAGAFLTLGIFWGLFKKGRVNDASN